MPSFYTSITDVRHGVVDARQRRGEVFRARLDGWSMHADLHGALTLALWPLLEPVSRRERQDPGGAIVAR